MASAELTILTALAAEADALKARENDYGSNDSLAINGRSDKNLVTSILQCGIGCDRLLKEARQNLENTAVIGNIGVCGGLAPDLKSGTIIIVDRIISNNNCQPTFPKQYIPALDIIDLLESVLQDNGIAYTRGTLLCSEKALITVEEKASAFANTSAITVDMESAGAAEAARQASIPFFCVKVVCDTAQKSVVKELLEAVDNKGNSRPERLFLPLLKRPWLAKRIWQTAREFSQAITGIKSFWEVAQIPLLQYIDKKNSAPWPSHSDFKSS